MSVQRLHTSSAHKGRWVIISWYENSSRSVHWMTPGMQRSVQLPHTLRNYAHRLTVPCSCAEQGTQPPAFKVASVTQVCCTKLTQEFVEWHELQAAGAIPSSKSTVPNAPVLMTHTSCSPGPASVSVVGHRPSQAQQGSRAQVASSRQATCELRGPSSCRHQSLHTGSADAPGTLSGPGI